MLPGGDTEFSGIPLMGTRNPTGTGDTKCAACGLFYKTGFFYWSGRDAGPYCEWCWRGFTSSEEAVDGAHAKP